MKKTLRSMLALILVVVMLGLNIASLAETDMITEFVDNVPKETEGELSNGLETQPAEKTAGEVEEALPGDDEAQRAEVSYSVCHILLQGGANGEDVMIAAPETYSAPAGTVVRGVEIAMPAEVYLEYEGLAFLKADEQQELVLEQDKENRIEVWYILSQSEEVPQGEEAEDGEVMAVELLEDDEAEADGEAGEDKAVMATVDEETPLEENVLGEYEISAPGEAGNGLHDDGALGWRLYINNQFASYYNGLYYDSNVGWWLVEGGTVNFGYNGLYCDASLGWWLVEGGTISFGYNGLYNDANVGWWLVEGGTISFGYNGLYYDANVGWWLVEGSKINFGYNGLYCDASLGWWLVQGGSINFDYNGLYWDSNVGWWLVQGGSINFGYNGLYNDANVGWWLVEGGSINFDYNGLYWDANVGWWLVQGGSINFGYNGLYNDANVGWWLVQGGSINFGYNGLYSDANVGWWLVEGGSINFGYNGLYWDSNVGWWLVQGGSINFGYNGLYSDANVGWWLVEGGSINFGYNGLYNDANVGWWLVRGGTVAFDYTGIWQDQKLGEKYVKNGNLQPDPKPTTAPTPEKEIINILMDEVDYWVNDYVDSTLRAFVSVYPESVDLNSLNFYSTDTNVVTVTRDGDSVYVKMVGVGEADIVAEGPNGGIGRYHAVVTQGSATKKPNAPTNVSVKALSSSSIKVSWTKPSNSVVTGYKVYYGTAPTSSKMKLFDTVTTTSATITGLKADTTYFVYIKASNAVGNSGPSDYASGNTYDTDNNPGENAHSPVVAVTGVSLDKVNMSLNVGESATLTATLTPSNASNQDVYWYSSDKSIATVSDGVVTAIADGSCTITVKTADGEKTATCVLSATKKVTTQYQGVDNITVTAGAPEFIAIDICDIAPSLIKSTVQDGKIHDQTGFPLEAGKTYTINYLTGMNVMRVTYTISYQDSNGSWYQYGNLKDTHHYKDGNSGHSDGFSITMPSDMESGTYLLRIYAKNIDSDKEGDYITVKAKIRVGSNRFTDPWSKIHVYNQWETAVTSYKKPLPPIYLTYFNADGTRRKDNNGNVVKPMSYECKPTEWDVRLWNNHDVQIADSPGNGNGADYTPFVYGRGCQLLTCAHAYQWFFGKANTTDEQVEILFKLGVDKPITGLSNLGLKVRYMKSTEYGWSGAKPVLDQGHIILAQTTDNNHVNLIVGYTIDSKGIGYVLVVDSCANSTIKRVTEAYQYDGTAIPGSIIPASQKNYKDGVFWVKFSDARRLSLLCDISK